MNALVKKRPDSARAQARRQQILRAAETCFSRKGFHSASMAEISQTAEMSTGHIYNYFESKESIIAAIVEQKIESLFSQEGNSINMFIHQHITDMCDPNNIALMFDILAEAIRNPKLAVVVSHFDKVAQRQLEKIYAEEDSTLSPNEISNLVVILRMLLFGLNAHKVCHPALTDKKMLQLIHQATDKLFKPEVSA